MNSIFDKRRATDHPQNLGKTFLACDEYMEGSHDVGNGWPSGLGQQ